MDYYNSKDFTTMQEEAIQRVHEMQQRSRNIVNGSHDSSEQSTPSPPPKPKQVPKGNGRQTGIPSLQSIINGLLGGSGGSRELFSISNIKIDEEKALIAMMIYILYKNGADVKLLLALGYLLL